ncbi:unnamed protein product [Closterium sp. Naga37s-1]|nr:unnamed protein product [Closterium sp. Naga37s-1]
MANSCFAISSCRPALLGRPLSQRLDESSNLRTHHESSFFIRRPARLTLRRPIVRAVSAADNGAAAAEEMRLARGSARLEGAPRGAKQVLLVDPVEAKRLAQEDLKKRAKAASQQKWREIEAINGAWAVIGIFAALVGEGFTQTGILGQCALYLELVAGAIESLAKFVGDL